MNTFTFHFEIQARSLAEAIALLGCSGYKGVSTPAGGTEVVEAEKPVKPTTKKEAASKRYDCLRKVKLSVFSAPRCGGKICLGVCTYALARRRRPSIARLAKT